MKVLVSGGTGLVGRYIVEELLAAGYSVIIGGRHAPLPRAFSRPVDFAPLSLDPGKDHIEAFDDAYFFVHAAFHHAPGKYRGGEGDDPETFRRLNLDGTVRLFEAAHLAAPGFAAASLRLTGVYGDLRPNKWDKLFGDYLSGRPIPARAGTEVHGRDVGQAVRIMLEADSSRISGETFNVSDLTLDTWDILEPIRWEHDCANRLPATADKSRLTPMDTEKIRALGWQPGGLPLFERTIHALATDGAPPHRSAQA
jgi:nucleoside-diphosphate-sugar epimerase